MLSTIRSQSLIQPHYGKSALRPCLLTYAFSTPSTEIFYTRPGRQVVEKQQPLQPSDYQQSLDAGTSAPTLTTSSVRYWSDFSRVFYHPRSLVQLYDYELDSSIRPFDRFAAGSDLFQSLDKDDDVLDRDFRPFVEECDRMQGIQVWAGLDDAWGGFAGEYVERLRDEYGKTCVWVWGSQAPAAGVQREKRRLRMANTAQSLNRLCASASMVVPMSLPAGRLADGVRLDASSPWHLSALLSAGLESATLPLRLTGQSGQHSPSMDDMTEFLNTGGTQTVARLKMGVGRRLAAAEPGEEDETDVIDLFGGMGDTGTKRKSSSRKFGQVTMDRGLGDAEPVGTEEEDVRQKPTRPLPGNPVIRKYVTPSRNIANLICPLANNSSLLDTNLLLPSHSSTATRAYTRKASRKLAWD